MPFVRLYPLPALLSGSWRGAMAWEHSPYSGNSGLAQDACLSRYRLASGWSLLESQSRGKSDRISFWALFPDIRA